jgi:hypothetical protein
MTRDSLRRCGRALEIGLSHALMKIGLLLFEAVQRAFLRRDAPASDRGGKSKEQRQVRLQMGMYPLLELRELRLSRPRPPLW